jgi:hypothetical protein
MPTSKVPRAACALLMIACTSPASFVRVDPAFSGAPVTECDLYVVSTPSAPYRVVGTISVSLPIESPADDFHVAALREAMKRGCQLVAAHSKTASRDQLKLRLVHEGVEEGGGRNSGRHAVREYDCGVYGDSRAPATPSTAT